MKKFNKILLVITILALVLAVSVACTPEEEQPDWKFDVGEDAVTVTAAGASEWAQTFDVNLKIVGGGDDVLFNGTVTITTSTQALSEVVQAAVGDKGLAQDGIDVGFITRIGDYENNSATNTYWMYTVNGETPQFGVDGFQIRDNDYVLLQYKVYEE